MILKRVLLLVLCCLFAKLALAQQEVNCEDAITQAEMNVCAQLEFEQLDKELNQVYKHLMDKLGELQKQDEGAGGTLSFYANLKEKIRESQRHWIKLRDADAEIASALYLGGSIAPLMYATSRSQHTRERIAFLKGLLQEYK